MLLIVYFLCLNVKLILLFVYLIELLPGFIYILKSAYIIKNIHMNNKKFILMSPMLLKSSASSRSSSSSSSSASSNASDSSSSNLSLGRSSTGSNASAPDLTLTEEHSSWLNSFLPDIAHVNFWTKTAQQKHLQKHEADTLIDTMQYLSSHLKLSDLELLFQNDMKFSSALFTTDIYSSSLYGKTPYNWYGAF